MDWHVRDVHIKGGVRPQGKIQLPAGEVTQVPVNVRGVENQRSEALFLVRLLVGFCVQNVEKK